MFEKGGGQRHTHSPISNEPTSHVETHTGSMLRLGPLCLPVCLGWNFAATGLDWTPSAVDDADIIPAGVKPSPSPFSSFFTLPSSGSAVADRDPSTLLVIFPFPRPRFHAVGETQARQVEVESEQEWTHVRRLDWLGIGRDAV